jgi:hypothetical protein
VHRLFGRRRLLRDSLHPRTFGHGGQSIAANLVNHSFALPRVDAQAGCIGVSDVRYNDPHLPDMSFSPAMTIAGPDLAKLPQAT